LQRNGARFALATTSPTDFDPAEARKSIDLILSLREKAACLTHYDEVRDLAEVGAQVRDWIDRSEAWLDEALRGYPPPAAVPPGATGASARVAASRHRRRRRAARSRVRPARLGSPRRRHRSQRAGHRLHSGAKTPDERVIHGDAAHTARVHAPRETALPRSRG